MISRGDNAGLGDVTLLMLGPLQVDVGGQRLAGISRKNQALLSYLATRSDTLITRDTLCGLLWPDSADEQARASLRQALSGLRRALGTAGEALVSDGAAISLTTGRLQSDLAAFAQSSEDVSISGLQAAAELYRGDFLEGFPQVSPEFDRWLDAERGALRSKFSAVLLRLSDAYEAERRIEDMIGVGQKLIALDPLQEHVHRRLMSAYRIQGRHDAALRQFDTLRQILSDQLGVDPEKPTLDLVRDIRAERQKGGPLAPPPVAPEPAVPVTEGPVAPLRPSIGILKFRGFPQGSDAGLMGEGISEDLTIDLSREASLLVISRQSSFQIDEDTMSPHDIGAQLGVKFYVSGSVRVFGQKLRVTAHLVNCATGHEVWAERYDRDLDDYFTIQSEISRTVSATVADRVAADLLEQSGTQRVETLESYQIVLRGINEVHRFRAEAYDAAVALFEEAERRTPGYGRALGWLALTRLYIIWNIKVSADLSDIVPIAERAVELDPSAPKGHCALGMCNLIYRHFDRAEFNFQSAMQANPNDDLVLTEYGRFLMYVERPEEGLQKIREAMRINPFHPVWFWSIQGRLLHTLERYEEAIRAFEKVQNPPFYVHAYLAGCYAVMGDEARMQQAKQRLFQAHPQFDFAQFKSIFPYKNPGTADRLFKSLELAGL